MKISIAIPDSALSDESLKIDKTRKISVLARACAIFKTDTIFVYQDGNNYQQDRNLLVMILRYLETPQFLRRRLFPKMNDLKFAGVLHPLRIPSHVTPANSKKINIGDVREGIVIGVKGKRFVDVGINQLIPFFGATYIGKRTTVQFKEGHPKLSVKEVNKDEVSDYWGYSVKERANLFSLMSEWKGNIIITSRKGKAATKEQISKYTKSDEALLIAFGSPEKGIHEILGGKRKNIQNAKSLNFFPHQATETVRLEEALIGTLAIINAQSTS
ncbi:putative RNA uridine N3 methyltransferase [Nitrosopumilus sp.]|uniref:putative RNA uridine N3 methyltransferase n=1 Tax=Nitrosopumilus sp. TaxID=2024843 RepID=UPI00292F252B|nr:putative RNA uridine N3 methyltransferase [Nitrosopumilus sp.]